MKHPYPWHLLNTIADERVIAIVREADAELASAAARAVLDAGMRVVEISMTTPGALDVVRELSNVDPRNVVGAGTVLDGAAAALAVAAGARLIVTPIFDRDVIAVARQNGAVTAVGCSTPTEMVSAAQAGADLIKIFPASRWRPSDLLDLRAALPHLAVVPTGGVSLESAGAWIDAGAVAVGIGSALTRGSTGEIHAHASVLRTHLNLAPTGTTP